MKLIGVTSVRGAAGVTTTSLLLASALAQPTVLLEADLAGGVLAVRYGLGREPGLTKLAATPGTGADGWRDHAQDAGGVPVIVGPDSPERARTLWTRAGTRIARALAEGDATCVVDLGRASGDAPLAQEMAALVVLVRPVAEHLVTLSQTLPSLRENANRVGVVLVGDGDYRPDDVGESLAIEVLGALPTDQRTAEAMSGRGRSTNIGRSALYRSVKSLATAIDTSVRASTLETVS